MRLHNNGKQMKTTIIALCLLLLTGCASQSKIAQIEEENKELTTANEILIKALKVANSGSVELKVDGCNNQRAVQPRTQVVNLGETAVFAQKDSASYELKAKPIKLKDGSLLVFMSAQWTDGEWPKFYKGAFPTKDSEVSPQIVLKGDGDESCFTITAHLRSTMSTTSSASPGVVAVSKPDESK